MASVRNRTFHAYLNSHYFTGQDERAHAVKEFDQSEIKANEQALIVLASWLGHVPEHVSLLIPANKIGAFVQPFRTILVYPCK